MKELKSDIEHMVSVLKSEGKIHLAKIIEESWDKTVLEYSRKLHSYKAKEPMEDIFKEAFSLELARNIYV